MINLEELKKKYDSLKEINSDINLLPFEKVKELEETKIKIINNFLLKIKKLDDKINIVSDENITIENIIDYSKRYLGAMNFFDKKDENGEKKIYCVFDFGVISIFYKNDKLKYKVSLFWDM